LGPRGSREGRGTLLDVIIGGALVGALYSLVAVGLNIQYGITRILNLAYGEILIIGAYITFIFFNFYGINPLLTLILSGLITFILGILLQVAVFRKLVHSSSSAVELEFRSLFACFGLIYIIQNLLAYIFGTTPIGVPYLMEGISILGERFKTNMVVTAVLSVLINAVMYVFIRFTKFGLAMRATAEEPLGAQLIGIDVLKVHLVSFSMGCFAAALSGSMVCLIYSNLTPYSGTFYTIIALIILILGGKGNFLGSVAGAFIIGCSYYAMLRFKAALADPVIYIILIVVLIIRPRGLFGRQ
jgi:branched-chain amino acid transport system permease protein